MANVLEYGGVPPAVGSSGSSGSSEPELTLRSAADTYEAILRVRNAAANRLYALELGEDAESKPDIASVPLIHHLNNALAETKVVMEELLPQHPAARFLAGIPGINRTVACRVVGLIPMESADDFDSFSKLRVFAGICPGRNRLVKGEKSCFSVRLKTACYVLFTSILKASPLTAGKDWAPAHFYTEIYNKWREKYAHREGVGDNGAMWLYKHGIFVPEKNPKQFKIHAKAMSLQQKVRCGRCQTLGWSGIVCGTCKKEGVTPLKALEPFGDIGEPGKAIGSKEGMWRIHFEKKTKSEWPDKRQHFAAKNKLLDVFLSHLWFEWRENLKWPTRDLYVHGQLGHEHSYDRTEFTSEAMASRKNWG